MARTWSRNLRDPIETRNARNRQTPSKTHQDPELQNLKNRSQEPVGTHQNLEPPSEPRNLSEPIEWNHLRFPEPVPGTRFLPRPAPARPEHTEIYIVQRPHSILLLGNYEINTLNKLIGEKLCVYIHIHIIDISLNFDRCLFQASMISLDSPKVCSMFASSLHVITGNTFLPVNAVGPVTSAYP